MPSPTALLRELWRRIEFHLHRDRFERDLHDEMRLHLELRAQDNERDGMATDDARSAARRRFGSPVRTQEAASDVMAIGWLERLAQDLRYAVRSLASSPAFTVVAVGSLAVGIGAALAVFTLVNAALFKPLPYAASDRLTIPFQTLTPGLMAAADTAPWSFAKYRILRDAVPAFQQSGFVTWDDVHVRYPGGREVPAERLIAEFATPGFLATLATSPASGRSLVDDDDAPAGAGLVTLISDRLWRRAFGARHDAIGATLSVNGAAFTVVGIMPPSFAGFRRGAELWMPLQALPATAAGSRPIRLDYRMGTVVARLASGVSLASARAQVERAAREVNRLVPEPFGGPRAQWGAGLVPLAEARRHPLVGPLFSLLTVAVGGVLVIVCANIAGLMLARARARQGELGIRSALGAGSGRLARQLMTESLLLSVIGAVPALLLGYAGAAAIVRLRPELPAAFVLLRGTDLLEGASLTPDWRLALFAVLLTILVGMLSGAAPAFAASKASVADLLNRSSGRAATSQARGRKGLVVGQVAVATMLLIGAGLLLRSFDALVRTDLGFDPSNLAVLRVTPSDTGVAALARRDMYFARLGALPGVEGVSIRNCTPFAGDCMGAGVSRIDDRTVREGEYPVMEIHVVTPGTLRVMRTPLHAGRALDSSDARGAPRAVMVNETAARILWPGSSALGRRVVASMNPEDTPSLVVGVVGDAKFEGIDQPTRPAIYYSSLQWPGSARGGVLYLRTRGDPGGVLPTVRREILRADPGAAIHDVTTGREMVRTAASSIAFLSALVSGFAVVAALLAVLGVYGVLSYLVTQRTREFGIRMAVGATPGAVLHEVARHGVMLTLAGLGVGVIAGGAATGVLSRFLYGVSRGDLLTHLLIVVVLGAAGMVAAFIPARRATRVDPIVALRE